MSERKRLQLVAVDNKLYPLLDSILGRVVLRGNILYLADNVLAQYNPPITGKVGTVNTFCNA